MKKTVKCKLQPTEEQKRDLLSTMGAFAAACNDILAGAQGSRKTRYDLHHEFYYRIKERYTLTANYVIRAIARVASAFGRGKKEPKQFRPLSLDLDKDLFRYNPRKD